jgi:methylglyoxal synthase
VSRQPYTVAFIAHDGKKDDMLEFAREIGALIVQGGVQGVVFFRDPLTAHPHEPDIQAVMKVCDVHDVPLATNRATAEVLLDRIADLVAGDA